MRWEPAPVLMFYLYKIFKIHLFRFLQVVDLEQGLLMNQDGQILQDSQGKPKRVVLGEDGRTIFGIIPHGYNQFQHVYENVLLCICIAIVAFTGCWLLSNNMYASNATVT